MALKIQLFDAAHSYGLDNMDATATFKAINQIIIGDLISTTNSWSGFLFPGQSGEKTDTYSGGFTIKSSLKNIDGVIGEISLKSIFKTDTNELLQSTSGDIPFTLLGTGATLQDDAIYYGDDIITGNAFNNFLRGYGGNDQINGGIGTDTAIFSGFESDYEISVKNNNTIAVVGIDGTDALNNIERIQFDDKKLAFDLDGNAGNVAKIMGAVFGKESLAIKVNTGTFLNLLDNGASYHDLMELALILALGNEFSNTAEIELLYQNLLGIQPTESDIEHWSNTISSGQFTQTTLALMAADTSINTNNINLTNLAKTGLDYANASSNVFLTGENNIDSLLGDYKWAKALARAPV